MILLVASTLVLLAATPTPAPADAPGNALAEYPSAEALRHYAIARLLDERGDGEAALGEYYRALALDPRSPAIARSVSELTARQGDARRSLEFAERALATLPGDPRSLSLKGAALFSLGDTEHALAALEAATRADSEQVEYFRTLARIAEQLDRLDVVERAYGRAVELDDDDAESWFQLAAARARLGRFAEADSALAISTRINPIRPGLFFLQGWIEESLGHDDRAIALYRQHLQIHDGDQMTRRRLTNLLAQNRRYADAWREAQIISRSHAGDLQSMEVEADLALYAGHVPEGLRLLDEMQERSPDDAGNAGRVLGVLARHQRSADGVTLAESWARRHPADYRGVMLVARALAFANRLAPAIEQSQRAIGMASDSLAPLAQLGRIYQGAKRYAEAESVWRMALRRFPDDGGVALDLAFCREQLGDLAGAEQAARDVLAREGDNPTALNFLGYLLADHNRNLEEAERLIRHAVDKEPDNGAFIDSMGWVYYRLGRLEEARRNLERAVVLTGGDPVVREHLGDVYKDMRFMELAREQYRKSLAGDTSNARVRAKLTEGR